MNSTLIAKPPTVNHSRRDPGDPGRLELWGRSRVVIYATVLFARLVERNSGRRGRRTAL